MAACSARPRESRWVYLSVPILLTAASQSRVDTGKQEAALGKIEDVAKLDAMQDV